MENNTIVKRIFIGVLLLVVIVAVAALVISKVIYKKSVTPAEQPNQTQSDIVKTEVDKTKDPEKFPAGVPIEEGAVVTQNYNAEATDGRYQATKVFETQKTLADNFNIYRDYMRQNGWDIKSTVNQENYKMLFATKGSTNLQVNMDSNTVLGIKTINISYTELGAEPK